jgi:dihydrolipoamide dehydrogenase
LSEDLSRLRVGVIGAGPGGYPAAFLAADFGMHVTLIDPQINPGGVCLYIGCIPSKALLHAARLLNEARQAREWGLTFAPPQIDLGKLRDWKDGVVRKMTGGLGVLAKARKLEFVTGVAKFVDVHTLSIAKAGGTEEQRTFDYIIVATGSTPLAVAGFPPYGERVMDSTRALMLESVPKRLLVVGGGYIGLELGTVYGALGSKVSVVERGPILLAGADRDLANVLVKRVEKLFDPVMVNTTVESLAIQEDGVHVRMLGLHAPEEAVYDKVLVSVGRRPSARHINLESTRVETNGRGFIKVDNQRRTAEPNVFAIGDVAGEPMLAHKATYEARIAVEAIAGKVTAFDAQAIPAVVFTDPEVAWAGLTETQALNEGRSVKIARFPWAASGRATTLDRNDGLTKLILDPRNEQILGVGIVGVGAGELIAEGVLAIEMGARAQDLERTIHAHPTLSETVMEAAEVYFGQSPHYIARKEALVYDS